MIYYYSDGENKFGPYTFEELLNQPIERESLIWHEGLDKWIYAHEVEALEGFFKTKNAAINHENITNDENVKVKTIHIVIGKKFLFWTIFIIILLAFVTKLAIQNSQKSDTVTEIVVEKPIVAKPVLSPKEKEEIKHQQIILKEKENPTSFLTLDYKTSKRFLSKKDIISGRIFNNASETAYSNMVILVKYLDKNNKEIGSKEYPIDKKVKPNSDTKFKLKDRNPEGTENVELAIKSAEIEIPE